MLQCQASWTSLLYNSPALHLYVSIYIHELVQQMRTWGSTTEDRTSRSSSLFIFNDSNYEAFGKFPLLRGRPGEDTWAFNMTKKHERDFAIQYDQQATIKTSNFK